MRNVKYNFFLSHDWILQFNINAFSVCWYSFFLRKQFVRVCWHARGHIQIPSSFAETTKTTEQPSKRRKKKLASFFFCISWVGVEKKLHKRGTIYLCVYKFRFLWFVVRVAARVYLLLPYSFAGCLALYKYSLYGGTQNRLWQCRPRGWLLRAVASHSNYCMWDSECSYIATQFTGLPI